MFQEFSFNVSFSCVFVCLYDFSDCFVWCQPPMDSLFDEAFVEPDQKSYRSPLRTSGYGHGHRTQQDQSTHLMIGLVVDLVGLIYLVSLDWPKILYYVCLWFVKCNHEIWILKMAMPRLAHCTWIAVAHGTRSPWNWCLFRYFWRRLETAGRTEDKDNSAFSAAVWAAEVQRCARGTGVPKGIYNIHIRSCNGNPFCEVAGSPAFVQKEKVAQPLLLAI